MVELVATGRRSRELAKEFGCHETSILSWIRRAAASVESSASVALGLHANERAELLALRSENRQIKLEAWYNPHRGHSSLGQISPINFERLNVKNKDDAKTQKLASSMDSLVPAQPKPSIDCDREVRLIENT